MNGVWGVGVGRVSNRPVITEAVIERWGSNLKIMQDTVILDDIDHNLLLFSLLPQDTVTANEAEPYWQPYNVNFVKFPTFYGAESSLQYSKDPNTGSYPEPHEATPHPQSLLLKIHFNIILLSMLRPPKWYSPFKVSKNNN
jgi:hypothetical protein